MTLTVCWSGSITPQNINEQRHTELEVIPRLAQTWMDALGNLPPLQQRKDKRQRQTKAAQTDESEEEDEEEDEQKLGVLWDRSHLRGSTSSVTSAPLQAYADREKSCARGDETQEIPTGFTRPRPERAGRWGLFLDLLVQALKIWGFPSRRALGSLASSVSDSSFVIVAAFLHLTSSHYEFCDVQSQHFSNKLVF